MSVPRKSAPPSASPQGETDLESTAELPVLDVAAYEAATPSEERLGSTDTWAVPSVAREPGAAAPTVGAAVPDESRSKQLEVSLHSLADNLREVEERLAKKGERLAEIEKALVHAHADRATAEQSIKELNAELEKARAVIAAREGRITELQRGIIERDSANEAGRRREKEYEEQLALRDKSLSLVHRDLTQAQTQAAIYMEVLQSAEGRRGIFEGISASLYDDLTAHELRVSSLEAQLSAAGTRTRELESDLRDREARIGKLESEVSDLRSSVAQRDEQLRELSRTSDVLKESAGTLGAHLAARDERIRAMEAVVTQHTASLAERQVQLDAAGAERTRLSASVAALEAKLAETTQRVAQLDTEVKQARARCEELETTGTTQRKRGEQLEAELATVRTELQQRTTALQEAGAQRSDLQARIAAAEARATDLQGRMDEQQAFVRVLQADSNASVARAKELEADLRAAEDMIHRLETDLRTRTSRLEEVEKTNQEWRSTVEEARHALNDRDALIRRLEEETAHSAVLLGSIQQRLDSTGSHEIAPEGDKRLLIRTEGDSEVVHVLGRKTTVGRTPDNDLQIDAKFISRHHAVILAGPAHTIIEDLNSTNGVLVNGRRITRQTLKDGDVVLIGKTQFRFAVRPVPPAAERRS